MEFDTGDVHHVDYTTLDPFKVAAQRLAATTDENIARLGLEVIRESRGESVFVVRRSDGQSVPLIGGVIETLGTKNLVADAIRTDEGPSHYDKLAQDTVAMVVNDMSTLGVVPVAVGALITTGGSSWFEDEARSQDLTHGWKNACDLARAVYGPGETAALSGLVNPDSAVLSGFAFGIVPEGKLVRGVPAVGDAIVCIGSSGIHANGLTDARALAKQLPDGYMTTIPDGRPFGEALLDPTPIYCGLIEDCLIAEIDVHYVVNVTGHGWRKLMRARAAFEYVMDVVPDPPPVLQFLQSQLALDDPAAYGTFNMGIGYAVFVPEDDVGRVVETANRHSMTAWRGGRVEQLKGARKVVIRPLGIEYTEDALTLR